MERRPLRAFGPLVLRAAREPIEVTAWGKVIGRWYPVGTSPIEEELVAGDSARLPTLPQEPEFLAGLTGGRVIPDAPLQIRSVPDAERFGSPQAAPKPTRPAPKGRAGHRP